MRINTLLDVVVVVLLSTTTVYVVDSAGSAAHPVEVKVPGFGDIHGREYSSSDGTHADEFLGIPYAEPPVGNLRFRPPKPFHPPNDWEFNATTLPNSCFQIPDSTYDAKYVAMWNPNTNLSEDCLYLNIWRPSSQLQPGEKRAVMVWIYGGGFSSGTSTLDLYNGRYLASHGDVIVVSFQYRVGVLGFLAACKASGAAGNAGLLDQQAALKWIHEHIEAFGGDADRITLFGESAGATSVGYHLLSKGSENLFKSAILQSAAIGGDWNFMNWDDAVKAAEKFSELVGCPTGSNHGKIVNCLREQPAENLVAKQFDVPLDGMAKVTTAFHPTVDGEFFTVDPETIIEDGSFHEKSLLLGATKNEGSYFMFYLYKDHFNVAQKTAPQIEKKTFERLVKQLKFVEPDGDDDADDEVHGDEDGGSHDKNAAHDDDEDEDDDDDDDFVDDVVLFEYGTPCDDDDSDSISYTEALEELLGDAKFKCPVVRMADAYTNDNQTVFLYSFNHKSSGSPWPDWTGAAHGYEIDHVFGVPSQVDHKSKYTNDERTLSNQMIYYWTNFAKTGDPNKGATGSTGRGAPLQWPKFSRKTRSVMVLNTKALSIQKGLRERRCHFWNKLVPFLKKMDSAAAGLYARQMDIVSTLLSIGVAVFLRLRT